MLLDYREVGVDDRKKNDLLFSLQHGAGAGAGVEKPICDSCLFKSIFVPQNGRW